MSPTESVLVRWVEEGTHSVISRRDVVEAAGDPPVGVGQTVNVKLREGTFLAQVLAVGMLWYPDELCCVTTRTCVYLCCYFLSTQETGLKCFNSKKLWSRRGKKLYPMTRISVSLI